MPTETISRPRSATGDVLPALGWTAVLAPVVYMTVSPAWAATTYVVLALFAVAIVAVSPDLDPDRGR